MDTVQNESRNGKKDLKITITQRLCVVFIVVTGAVFIPIIGYFFWNEKLIWGILLTIFYVCGVGLFCIEKRNSYLLINIDGTLECDLLKKKQYIAWENCDQIFKDNRPYLTNVTVVQTVRTTEEEKKRTGKMVKTNIIMIPWSYFSKEEKARFLEIIAESTLPTDMKAAFLEEMR